MNGTTNFPLYSTPHPMLIVPLQFDVGLLSNLDLRSSTGTISRHLNPLGSGHQCSSMAVKDGRLKQPTLPPCTVQQFNFCQALADHGGEEKGEENAANQHVVVVILEHVELLGRVDPGLVDVKTVSDNLCR